MDYPVIPGEMGSIGKRSSGKGQTATPTIRSIEKTRLSELKSRKEGVRSFELDIETAPGKPLRSVPKLRAALNEFFERHQDDPYVTINELASAIGFADADALSKALYDDSNPKYTALLRQAYSLIEDVMTKRMLYVADQRCDSKGYQYALERLDRKRDKYDPAAMQADASVKIAIEMKETKEIQAMVSDRLSALLSAQKGSAIDVKARTSTIPEPLPAIPEAMEVQDGSEEAMAH